MAKKAVKNNTTTVVTFTQGTTTTTLSDTSTTPVSLSINTPGILNVTSKTGSTVVANTIINIATSPVNSSSSALPSSSSSSSTTPPLKSSSSSTPVVTPIKLVQSYVTSIKSNVITLPVKASLNGDLIVLGVNPNASTSVSSITDNVGNTYVSANVRGIDTTSGNSVEIWYALNTKAGVTSIVVNLSASALTAVWMTEFSGATALGKALAVSNAAASATVAAPTISVSVETVAFSLAGVQNAIGNATSPCNSLTPENGNGAAYVIGTSGHLGGSWTQNSGTYCAATATFVSGGSPTPPPSGQSSSSVKPPTPQSSSSSKPPVVVPPSSSVLPGMPGTTYTNDVWKAMFPQDSNGFTIFPTNNPIYVGSQSGDAPDLNTAIGQAQSAGSLCILFRRGETYTAAQINGSIPAGKSPSQPFVVGSTADTENPRPILEAAQIGSGMTYNVFFGLDFTDPAGQNNSNVESGFRLVDFDNVAQYLWIEDCRMMYIQSGIELQEDGTSGVPFRNVILRRNVVAYTMGQKYGMYMNNICELDIQENFLDMIGWRPNTPSDKNIFTHGIYFQEYNAGETAGVDSSSYPNALVRVCNNWFCRPAATGYELRPGGMASGNISIGCPSMGLVAEYPSIMQYAVADGAGYDLTMGTGVTRGLGFLAQICPTVTLDHLYCIDHQDTSNNGWAIQVNTITTGETPSVATVATISNSVVCDWDVWNSNDPYSGPPFQIYDNNESQYAPQLTFVNCDFPNMSSTQGILSSSPKYVDNTRCLGTYATSLGYADTDAFLAACLDNCKGNWNTALSAQAFLAYVEAGFTVA